MDKAAEIHMGRDSGAVACFTDYMFAVARRDCVCNRRAVRRDGRLKGASFLLQKKSKKIVECIEYVTKAWYIISVTNTIQERGICNEIYPTTKQKI
ncbi:hypothetical protein [Geobacillus virus E2]|uniref:hypothetical protein n=1 Tax=Geobacillus virus E2 TaxID=447909 RepID=UPI000153680D|nr:hypothetical protein GBVE2_p57 [Geobacillus virus E2]ABI36875.1 hypothetical protein [Geobacillus virus E2]